VKSWSICFCIKMCVKCWRNLLLVSISSTFYVKLLHQCFCFKKFQTQNVTREKLRKYFRTKNLRRKCWWNRLLSSDLVTVFSGNCVSYAEPFLQFRGQNTNLIYQYYFPDNFTFEKFQCSLFPQNNNTSYLN